MARRRYQAVSSGLVHPDPKAWRTLENLSGGVGLGPVNVELGASWKADLMPTNDMLIVSTIGVVQSYDGDLDAGKRWHGQGTAAFWNGAKYSGDFVHGNMHGKGTYTWPDGCQYTGDVNHNEMSGQGKLDWPGGDWYIGSVEQGLRHGSGKFVKSRDGSGEVRLWYEGDWVYGERHGKGKLVIEQTGEWYSGEWRHGEKNGHGTMQYKSGNVYSGQWVDGKREGQGRMQWLDANELYVGEWAGGRQHGSGVHFWLPADGDTAARNLPALNYYDGEWKDGLRSGFGIFNYADGSYYKGRWDDNFKHGAGTYVSSQGVKTAGSFDKGHLVGSGGEQFVGPNSVSGKAPSSDGEVLLEINDLVSWADNGDRLVGQVKKVLLSYISELKVIFQAYSKSDLQTEPEYKDPNPSRPGSSARILLPRNTLASEFKERQEKQLRVLAEFAGKTMTLERVLRFAKDCQLQDGNLPLVEIERVVHRVQHGNRRNFKHLLQQHAPTPTTSDTATNPAGEKRLLFSEFLEVVVRLADIKYEEIGTLPARVSFCLYRNVFPHVDLQGPIAHAEDVNWTFATADAFFADMFSQCLAAEPAPIATNDNANDNDNAPRFLRLHRVLTLVESLGMVDGKVTTAKTLQLLAATLCPDPDDAAANLGNLQLPVTFPEFVDLMRALAASRFEEVQAPDSVLAPLKHAIQTRSEGLHLLGNAEAMAAESATEQDIQATEEVLAVADQTIKDAFTLGRGKAKEDKARIAKVKATLEEKRQLLEAAKAPAEEAEGEDGEGES